MHYTYDLISWLIFIPTVFVYISGRKRLTRKHRSINYLMLITFIYLSLGIYYAFSWHNKTGKDIIEPFYQFDTLYFTTLSLILGFIGLYFMDMCIGRVKIPQLIFLFPVIMAIIFIFFNKKYGLMFYYDNNDIYHRGPLLWTNYLLWIVYFGGLITLILKSRDKLTKNTTIGFLLFFLVEIGLQVYQFFNVNFYIGGIAYSSGLLYLVVSPLFLEHQADELTNLFNRNGFIRAVEEKVKYVNDGEYCLAAVDISDFETINEKFGYKVGNEILKHVGEYLQKTFSSDAIVGRFDSDHFYAFVKKDDIKLDYFTLPINEINENIDEIYNINIVEGVYQIDDRQEEILSMCDKAMFSANNAKNDNSGSLAFFDEKAKKEMDKEKYIIGILDKACEEKRFKLYFQPIYNAKTLKLSSAEV